ncbi:hypothetical protein G6O67_007562 [Ophiocordyceps sinensis]|uniref:Uncharacterized protein n=1 Tax=Ophiocordyceps sinensis TaxID=72228 RepID=A0A8H4LUW0_9HYPO|nr:hypothetical protein G6O67_007562 [Ophiocordyceps sinensis]
MMLCRADLRTYAGIAEHACGDLGRHHASGATCPVLPNFRVQAQALAALQEAAENAITQTFTAAQYLTSNLPCPVVEAGVLAAKAYIQVHGYNPTAEGLQGTDKHATNMRRLPCGHLAWRLLEPSVHVASRVLMSGQTKKAFSAGPRWGTSDAPSATSFASGNGEERSYRNEYCYLQTQQDIKIPKFFCTFAEVVNRKTIPNKKADPEGYFQYVAEKLTASAVT